MRRAHRNVPVCLLLLLGATLGCGSSQYATPEAIFEAAKVAAEKENYTAFCDCLTPDGRDEMAVRFVLIGILLKRVPEEGPDAKKANFQAAKITAVMKKHGLTKKTVPEIDLFFAANEEESRKELLKLASPITDRPAFIADFFGALKEIAGKSDLRLIEKNAKLEDLDIQGDTATATIVQTRAYADEEKRSPVGFQKVDGQWKIDALPNLLD